jgi:hypothetical protein
MTALTVPELHDLVDRYDAGDPGVTLDAYDAAIETLVELGEL